MPKLRYRWWDSEAISVKKAVIGNREYLFEQANQGIGSVPAADALYLLRNTNNYEVVLWCERCEAEPTETVTAGDAPGINLPEPSTTTESSPAAPKRRGRPRKG